MFYGGSGYESSDEQHFMERVVAHYVIMEHKLIYVES